MDGFFTKEDTKALKGIAIVLMLMHHLWGFPERLAGEGLRYLLSFNGQSLIGYLGDYGKICVALFAFLSGYGVYSSSRWKKFDIVGRLKALYIPFWKIFLVFVPIAFIFVGSSAAADGVARYAVFSPLEFIQSFFGFNYIYNAEWWFLGSFVFALVSFPIMRAVCDRCSAAVNILLVIVFSLMLSYVFPALGSLPAFGSLNDRILYKTFFCQNSMVAANFFMGAVAAKDGLLIRLRNSLAEHSLLNPFFDVAVLAATVLLRQSIFGADFDLLLVPMFAVAAADMLGRLRALRTVLIYIGRQSTGMWLCHSFFCYYFPAAASLVAAPKWAVPSLLVLVVMSYGASAAVYGLWSGASKLLAAKSGMLRRVAR